MGIQIKGEKVTIFQNEYNGNIFYNAGLSKKLQDDTYENGSMSIQFRKGEIIPHKSKINITNGFMSFYKKDKATIPQIFVMDYEMVESGADRAEQPTSNGGFVPANVDDDLPF